MDFYLTRYGSTPFGTFGCLRLGDDTYYSVERQWLDNRPFVSCIPVGTYTLEEHNSTEHPHCLALCNRMIGVTHYKESFSVRYAILIHVANTASKLQGCIAFGDSLGFINGQWAVKNSRTTVRKILNTMREGDRLVINWQHHAEKNFFDYRNT